MANELKGGTTTEGKKSSAASSQMCCTPSFRFLEKHPFGISASQHHILGAASGHENCIKSEDVSPKVDTLILEATEDNLLTSTSTAREVTARVNLLQAVQFFADSWQEISTRPFRTALLIVVLSTQAWRCQTDRY
jgi:hypothetical protein